MEAASVKHRSDVALELHHCMVCGAPQVSGELCRLCERRGLSPEQYVEFFWEEA
jgi:hypothetical protein